MNPSVPVAALVLALAVAASAPAIAQEPAQSSRSADAVESSPEPDAEDSESERIVVRGRRPEGMTLEDFAVEFVLEIGDPIPGRTYGYARWERPLCVGVANVRQPAAGRYIVDRVSEVAAEVGLATGRPGCVANIRIVFAASGQELASYLVEENPGTFRPFHGTGGTTQGYLALEEFKTSDAPVRWWQISMVVDETGNVAISLPGQGPPVIAGSGSRIRTPVRDELWGAYVVVDVNKVEGASWAQLADYLAMVTLAQIKPDARPAAYDSILNLFHSSAPPDGLTAWDRNYLYALYDIDLLRTRTMQRGALARTIADDESLWETIDADHD